MGVDVGVVMGVDVHVDAAVGAGVGVGVHTHAQDLLQGGRKEEVVDLVGPNGALVFGRRSLVIVVQRLLPYNPAPVTVVWVCAR